MSPLQRHVKPKNGEEFNLQITFQSKFCKSHLPVSEIIVFAVVDLLWHGLRPTASKGCLGVNGEQRGREMTVGFQPIPV
ncbi:MAG: hypothetical protein MUF49_20295 [Oculatellaceae cyanobacterium Prado106]|jgi:hypothetical protein|nr:hypothetical protein [Oculatellaceae cyanobacterium Prado106]